MIPECKFANGNVSNEQKMQNTKYTPSLPSKVGWIMGMCMFVILGVIFFMMYWPESFYTNSKRPEIQMDSYINISTLTHHIYCDFVHKLQDLYERILKHNPKLDIMKEINDFISGYKCQFFLENQQNRNKQHNVGILDVCEEKYMGSQKASNYFAYKGFYAPPCENVKPFHQVITIGLDFTHCLPNCTNMGIKILNQIETLYPQITVFLATPTRGIFNTSLLKTVNIEEFNFSKNVASGAIWNTLGKHVKTPYFFIGRNLVDVTWHMQLERQVRVLSELKNVVIAGGAVRTLAGNWSSDCYQTSMLNYIYQFKDGYYQSKKECMFCDYLNGPFTVRVETLNDYKFNEKISEVASFADFYLHLKESELSVVSCPDVMNFVKDAEIIMDRKQWRSFAEKYELNKILFDSGSFLYYSCEEIMHSCSALSVTKSFMLPLCCQIKIVDAIALVTKYLEKNNISYWIFDGTLLGAVKLGGPMPWDVDVDIFHDASDYNFILKSKSFWQKNGFKTEYRNPDKEINGLKEARTRLYFHDMYIELFSVIFGKNYTDANYNTTVMKFDNIYVKAPINPGLAARNLYGRENLKHAQSWIILKKKMWDNYESGSFLPCKIPKHHACLDNFPPDGNLFYKFPN